MDWDHNYALPSPIVANVEDDLDPDFTVNQVAQHINKATKLVEVCKEWNISKQNIIAGVTDGAANMLKAIDLSYGKEHHILCFAHTLNLVADHAISNVPVLTHLILDVKNIVRWFKQSVIASNELRKATKDIANNVLNTTKLPISTCSMIKVSSLTPEKVYYKKTFSDEEHWKDMNVLKKKNATSDQLKNQTLIPMPKPTLSLEKKKDLLAMIPFLPEEQKLLPKYNVMK